MYSNNHALLYCTETIITRLFTKDGDKKVPTPFIIVLAVHHTLASSLGLPMILHYRNLRALHWLCFDLQFGATMIGE